MFNYLLILINKGVLINGIPVKPCAIWNFNKFTSIKDVNNLQNAMEKTTHRVEYLIVEILSLNLSTVILDNFDVIQHSIVFITCNIKERN